MICINVMSKELSAVLRARHWREANPERARLAPLEWHHKNRDQRCAAMRAAYASNPKKYRDSNRRSRFGETAPEHLQMQIVKQNNCCAICGANFEQAPCLDHNHETGQLRGALCGGCNRGIGNFAENIDALRKAADYLVGWANAEQQDLESLVQQN